MPSSVKLDPHQKSRVEDVVLKAAEEAGLKGLTITPALIDRFIEDLPERCHRYFNGRDEKFNGFNQVLREMEHSGRFVVKEAPQGMKRGKTLVLASLVKDDQSRSLSRSNNRSRSGVIRSTHDIANGAAAPA